MDRWIVAIVLGNLAFTIGIVWLILHHRMQKARQQSDERLRVLERFSSGAELTGFLSSPAGVRLLDILAGSKPDPRRSALTAVSIGTFLFVLGAAFLLLDYLGAGALMVPGVLTAGAGLGELLSAVISLRLARRLGVLETGHPEASRS